MMFNSRRQFLTAACGMVMGVGSGYARQAMAGEPRPPGLLERGLGVGESVLNRVATAAGANDLINLKSPNGYYEIHPDAKDQSTVNCVFFCDAIANTKNWRLRFSSGAPSARYWADRITNAKKSMVPSIDSIMVLDGWGDNDYGHVGWVKDVNVNRDGSYTIKSKEGFPRNGYYCGMVNNTSKYYFNTWTITGGFAKVLNGSISIKVKGFLQSL